MAITRQGTVTTFTSHMGMAEMGDIAAHRCPWGHSRPQCSPPLSLYLTGTTPSRGLKPSVAMLRDLVLREGQMPVRVGLVYREERAREDTGCMNSKVFQLGKPLT